MPFLTFVVFFCDIFSQGVFIVPFQVLIISIKFIETLLLFIRCKSMQVNVVLSNFEFRSIEEELLLYYFPMVNLLIKSKSKVLK